MKDALVQFAEWREIKVKKSTVKGYNGYLRQFCLYLRGRYMGDPDISGVTVEDVTSYLQAMLELGWERNGFLGRCMALKKFFEFFRLQGYSVMDPNLIPVPKPEYSMPRVATDEIYQKLLSIIPRNNIPHHIRNLAIVNLLWDTGARIGEIMALNVKDIQDKKALIYTEKSRGKRPMREIFWVEETQKSVEAWIEKREHLAETFKHYDAEALFVSINSIKSGARFSIKGAGEMLRRYSNKAELEPVNAHSFRHHMGHDIIKKGGSAADVMNILGHSTLASSSVYTMMNNTELEARYRLIKEGKLSPIKTLDNNEQ